MIRLKLDMLVDDGNEMRDCDGRALLYKET